MNKYNDTYHSTIKVKLVDVKLNTYINSSEEINDKDPQFNIGDIFAISKYKNNFAKFSVRNWRTCKNAVLWTLLLVILMEKKLLDNFTKKNCKKQMKKNLDLKN